MAAFTRTEVPGGHLFIWNLTTADHTGNWARIPGGGDKSVHFIADTAGSATAAVEGSNYEAGDGQQVLSDPQGNAISKTATALETILENPLLVRPRLTTVGTGAVWRAAILVRSTMR